MPEPYTATRLDALRQLRREGYVVVNAESWRLRSDFGVVPWCREVHANACSCSLPVGHDGVHRTLWGDTWTVDNASSVAPVAPAGAVE